MAQLEGAPQLIAFRLTPTPIRCILALFVFVFSAAVPAPWGLETGRPEANPKAPRSIGITVIVVIARRLQTDSEADAETCVGPGDTVVIIPSPRAFLDLATARSRERRTP